MAVGFVVIEAMVPVPLSTRVALLSYTPSGPEAALRHRCDPSSPVGGGAMSQSTLHPRHDFRPLLLKHVMDPEAVEPGFLNGDDRTVIPSFGPASLPQLRKQTKQSGDVSCPQRVFRHPLTVPRRQRRDQPDRTTQLQGNEDCTKIEWRSRLFRS
ncbi:hypothetical protein GGE12_004346 [Rhizobium mongolense]|uniref:Uncharacterized protein n=1 Tax=Rhizobium mongolense TaxID=57676 RepID=A0A7W6RQ08_9HYPH|nr:hypothetical protein [Rhizobium mongolense]